MAKKKTAKRAKTSHVVLRFISDKGHGWVEVPATLCKKLGLGTDFTRRGKYCYLEEDCEAADLERALKKRKMTVQYADHTMDDFDAWLGCETWPYIPACVYGDDANLTIAALEDMATHMKQLHLDTTYTAAERKMWRQQWEDCQRLAIMFSTMNGAE